MKLSKVFLASVFLTAVILAVIGGLVTNAFAAKSSTPQVSQEDIQAYQEREEAYNQLIEQANQQIEKANQDLQAMQVQLIEAQNQPTTNQPTVDVGISAEEAQKIADQAAAEGFVASKGPELVDFEGKVAYEIAYEDRSIYVNAKTGDVLFNGTVPQEITQDMAVKIATEYMKNTDVYQADEIIFRDAPLYRVIFKNSTIVYLDKTGQITYILRDSMASRTNQVESSSDSGNSTSSHETGYDEHEDEDEGHDD